ncbi:sugar-binding protein [Salinibacterium sp. NK8237]|uniref:substrate-binding domain-containing protein n=1 Tax=Salinibacterium sp. NK8237 TaxID=2792038 RepID=UPI0018CE6BDF|nr:sugar-binding protein [Salinibacterium sp. NK8237]MBH0130079.1 sugar-binding protein [Salinibacterium sp. NK8237]
MKKLTIGAMALAAALALTMSGCSARSDTSSTEAGAGFDADSSIGIALPDKTSENWVLAGELFTDGLTEAGFTPDVQYAPASNTVAEQQNQITSMITNGAKVIVIGAKDGAQLAAQVETARDAGITVIAYDRLILNTDAVDYYISFDPYAVGVLQGEALLEGLAATYPDKSTYNVELFSGSPDDNNSGVFFNGAMSVLQPKIDDGTLVVVSGETELAQTATQGWLAQNAQSRMDTLLAGYYQSTDLDGVLSPNDTLARAILESVRSAGKDLPILTGQDSEVESVKSIVAGEQYMTVYKDTRALVAAVIDMVSELQAGNEISEINDTETYDNGVKVVPSYLLAPVAVTKDNAAEVYAENPSLAPLTE